MGHTHKFKYTGYVYSNLRVHCDTRKIKFTGRLAQGTYIQYLVTKWPCILEYTYVNLNLLIFDILPGASFEYAIYLNMLRQIILARWTLASNLSHAFALSLPLRSSGSFAMSMPISASWMTRLNVAYCFAFPFLRAALMFTNSTIVIVVKDALSRMHAVINGWGGILHHCCFSRARIIIPANIQLRQLSYALRRTGRHCDLLPSPAPTSWHRRWQCLGMIVPLFE